MNKPWCICHSGSVCNELCVLGYCHDGCKYSEIAWALNAPETEVGPACSNATVPTTIVMDDTFREPYSQGYRHALSDVRKLLRSRGTQR